MAEGYAREPIKATVKNGGKGSGKTVAVKKGSYGAKRK